jgi:selenocysteine lyase/cysteine desulfurase
MQAWSGSAAEPETWGRIRSAIIGRDALIETPFGRRRLTYADHTASGRGVDIIERRIQDALVLYGNTHTEDDATGIITSQRLRSAEATIRRLVNAGPEHKLVPVGAGTTAAVHLLQQILGVYMPPAGRDFYGALLKDALPPDEYGRLMERLRAALPVVFVGPYEHHSNEVSWRECLAEVVEIELTADGLLDLDDLRDKVSRDAYRERRKIGAFSAASNVTGVKTPVTEVARILHRAGALACFDYAAIAPYDRIDMRPEPESVFDALYFSAHKFLGGPGAAGILVFHERIYRADLPPTVGAGGTVDFVNFDGQAYMTDIEARETPGTPAILQTMRAALAMELKESLGMEAIADREAVLTRHAYERLSSHPSVALMGNVGPEHRLPIFSFNVRVGASWLHPRFVTTLLNDLFGIQSRAGCSCAAPYGHRILHIDRKLSSDLRRSIMRGNIGLKPGWARVNFHFLHTDEEVDFLCDAILFVADRGKRFLPLYDFDIRSGTWRHREHAEPGPAFGLAAGSSGSVPVLPEEKPDPAGCFQCYLGEAERLADSLGELWSDGDLKSTEKDLIPFVYMQEVSHEP